MSVEQLTREAHEKGYTVEESVNAWVARRGKREVWLTVKEDELGYGYYEVGYREGEEAGAGPATTLRQAVARARRLL